MKSALLHALASILLKLAASITGLGYRNLPASVVEDFNDIIPVGRLLAPLTDVSEIGCGVMCANAEKCVSFFYNKQIRGCKIYDGGLNTFPVQVVPGSGYIYYRFVGGMIGHSCSSNDNCKVGHSECRMDGVCGCKAGYGYHHANKTCDPNGISGMSLESISEGCKQYGETFQIFKQTALRGLDKVRIVHTTTEECAEICIEASDFTCMTFDTKPSVNDCYLQEVSVYTHPDTYEENTSYDSYQRNCA